MNFNLIKNKKTALDIKGSKAVLNDLLTGFYRFPGIPGVKNNQQV